MGRTGRTSRIALGVASAALLLGVAAVVGTTTSTAADASGSTGAGSGDRSRACSAQQRAEHAGLPMPDHAVPKRWAAPVC